MPGAAAAHTEKALPFQFNVPINKGYVDNKGKMHVLAIVSDDSVDLQRDRMTDRALSSMAKQVESKLPFYETHGSVFPFGRTTKGKVIKIGMGYGLEVDVELDGDYPQARELYREVKAGNCRKQLSVGGELTSMFIRSASCVQKKVSSVRLTTLPLTTFVPRGPERPPTPRQASLAQ